MRKLVGVTMSSSFGEAMDTRLPAIFTYQRRWFIPVLLFAVIVNLVYLNYLIALKESLASSITFFLIFPLFFSFLECILIAQRLDIVIDSQGISKTIFGKRWSAMKWENIGTIKADFAPRYSEAPLRIYLIFPKLWRPGFFRGVVSFNGERTDLALMLELIGRFIAENGPEVKVVVDGKEASVADWVATGRKST